MPDTIAPQIPPLTAYVSLVVGDEPEFASDVYGEIGVLSFDATGRISVSTTSVDALLALADAAQECARQLRVAQLRGEARRAVA
jgi:hypothetical protein